MLKLSLFLLVLSMLCINIYGHYYHGKKCYSHNNHHGKSDYGYKYNSKQSYKSQHNYGEDEDDPVDCNDGGFFQKPNPKNCNTFYKCNHGRPVLFHCAKYTEYSPTQHVCVDIDKSDCHLRKKSNQNSQSKPKKQPDDRNKQKKPESTTQQQNPNYDELDNMTFLDDEPRQTNENSRPNQQQNNDSDDNLTFLD